MKIEEPTPDPMTVTKEEAIGCATAKAVSAEHLPSPATVITSIPDSDAVMVEHGTTEDRKKKLDEFFDQLSRLRQGTEAETTEKMEEKTLQLADELKEKIVVQRSLAQEMLPARMR